MPIQKQVGLDGVGDRLGEGGATSVSRKSRADRACSPSRALRRSKLAGPAASSVNTPSSMALSSVLAGQKAKPVCRIFSGVGCSDIGQDGMEIEDSDYR